MSTVLILSRQVSEEARARPGARASGNESFREVVGERLHVVCAKQLGGVLPVGGIAEPANRGNRREPVFSQPTLQTGTQCTEVAGAVSDIFTFRERSAIHTRGR